MHFKKLPIYGLLLLCVMLYICRCNASKKIVNAALGKKAYQVNTYQDKPKFAAGKAVNGNVKDHSSTKWTVYYWKWFIVDLASIHQVSNTRIFTHIHYRTQMPNIEIWISTTAKYSGSGTPDWSKFKMCGMLKGLIKPTPKKNLYFIFTDIRCTGNARYVALKYFSPYRFGFSELMVFAKKAPSVNVAKGKKAYVIDSTKALNRNYPASNGVDGKIYTITVSKTRKQNPNGWWMVDLGSIYQLSYIDVIYSQYSHHFKNRIWISATAEYNGKYSYKYKGSPEPDWSKFKPCTGIILSRKQKCTGKARYVAIRTKGMRFRLRLGEVRVFGKKMKMPCKMKSSHPAFYEKLGTPSSQFLPDLLDYENNKLLSSRAVNCALQCVKQRFACCQGFYFHKNNGKCIAYRGASLSKLDGNPLWIQHIRIG